MSIYISSDLHLNHNKPFVYEARGFNTIQEMNEAIINNFNQIIKPNDTLILAGDIIMGQTDEGLKLFDKLPFPRIIVLGNHDTTMRINGYKARGSLIADCYKIEIDGWTFYISHFPMMMGGSTNDFKRRKILNLAGHTHTKNKMEYIKYGSYNVGVDSHDCCPVAIDTILYEVKNIDDN